MILKIHSPMLDIGLDDEGRYGDVEVLDQFMYDHGNTVVYPTFSLTSEYDPTDDQSVYWAALMFVEENTPGEIEIEAYDFEPVEPDYETTPDAVF